MIKDKVKQAFVREVLQEEGAKIISQQNQAIGKYKIKRSALSPLLNSMQRSVTTDDTFDGELSLKHIIYQRFLDMKFRGTKRNRKYPIHNRIIYGHLNNIIYKLQYYFTQDTIERIKAKLDNTTVQV